MKQRRGPWVRASARQPGLLVVPGSGSRPRRRTWRLCVQRHTPVHILTSQVPCPHAYRQIPNMLRPPWCAPSLLVCAAFRVFDVVPLLWYGYQCLGNTLTWLFAIFSWAIRTFSLPLMMKYPPWSSSASFEGLYRLDSSPFSDTIQASIKSIHQGHYASSAGACYEAT